MKNNLFPLCLLLLHSCSLLWFPSRTRNFQLISITSSTSFICFSEFPFLLLPRDVRVRWKLFRINLVSNFISCAVSHHAWERGSDKRETFIFGGIVSEWFKEQRRVLCDRKKRESTNHWVEATNLQTLHGACYGGSASSIVQTISHSFFISRRKFADHARETQHFYGIRRAYVFVSTVLIVPKLLLRLGVMKCLSSNTHSDRCLRSHSREPPQAVSQRKSANLIRKFVQH